MKGTIIKSNIRGKKLAWLLSYLYFVSYITRINFAAVVQEVISETGYEKSAISIVLVCLSISYGIGQIVNGYIGDKIKPQNLILVGICIASVVNFMFPFCSFSIPLLCVIWTINGFAQAMMWPPMVKIMVNTMNESDYNSSVVIVSIGSSIGTIFVYLTAPLIIKLFSWEIVLFSAAILGAISSLIWFVLKDRCYDELNIIQNHEVKSKQKFTMPKSAISPFILIVIAIIFVGMIRDGITSWMPTYLSENFGLTNDKSIFLTVTLAIVSIFSFVGAGAFYRKFFINEISCATVIFLISMLCGIILLFMFDFANAVITALMLALITGCMHGINLMLVSHVPKRFKKYGNISTISGFVNSFTYIGAAVATYGIAQISELLGWKITVFVWLVILILGTFCCFIAIKKWKKFISH